MVNLITLEKEIIQDELELFKCINEINQNFDLIKITLSEQYDLLVSYDSTSIDIEYSQFEFIIGILGYFSEMIFREVGFADIEAEKNHTIN